MSHVPTIERDGDAVLFLLDGHDTGVEEDRLEHRVEFLRQRAYEIAVSTGQESGQHFHHRDFRAERGIDGTHLESDITAADHQQFLGHLLELERAGGIP